MGERPKNCIKAANCGEAQKNVEKVKVCQGAWMHVYAFPGKSWPTKDENTTEHARTQHKLRLTINCGILRQIMAQTHGGGKAVSLRPLFS